MGPQALAVLARYHIEMGNKLLAVDRRANDTGIGDLLRIARRDLAPPLVPRVEEGKLGS
jgi:hypothetical protein